MFASMAHGATFGELCVRFNPGALNINDRALVLFGLIEGLIRRVDKYPVTVSRNLFVDAARLAPAAFAGGVLLGGAAYRSRASRPLPQQTNQHQHHYQPQQHQHQHHPALHQQHLHQHNSPTMCAQANRANGAFTTSTPRRRTGDGGQSATATPPPAPACHYNGLKSLDEICCARGISCQQLEQQLARDRHVIVLLR